MTVVLLHGLGVGQRYFEPLARELGGAPLRPDLRRPEPMGELAARVERLLDGPALLVANSMGCQVAVEVAVRRPQLVRGLVLVGPTVDPRARSFARQLARLLATAWYEPLRLVAIVVVDYFTLGPIDTLRQARHALAHPIEERLPGVQAPTVVVRGAHDRLCPEPWARAAVERLPEASLVTVAGAGHAAHFSHPGEVAAVVRRLDERTRAAPG
ncbi:MAG TPA: alpha/beta hydrolase [Gaiellaceae bacterium]|nr:alpha/beta hydrolase [Gaiellaceae bacterium]